MISDLIVFVGVLVGWCCGIHLITGEGYLLHFIRKPFEKTRNVTGVSQNVSTTLAQMGVTETVLPDWIGRMLFVCISCMASLHGFLIYTILWFGDVIEFSWIVLILGVVIASFLQTFVWSLYEKIMQCNTKK